MAIFKKIGTVVATFMVLCSSSIALTSVHVDTYYSNGVYCNKNTCHVDLVKSWDNIVNNSSVNWIIGGNTGWNG